MGSFVSAYGHIRVRPRAGFVTAYGQKPMSLDKRDPTRQAAAGGMGQTYRLRPAKAPVTI